MAKVVEFPDCCGLLILNKFLGGHPGSDIDDCMEPEELEGFLREQERKYYGQRSGLVAVLSEPQNDKIGQVFKERRWKLLLDGVLNPRSGSEIFMWFRDLNETEQRHKRIFGT